VKATFTTRGVLKVAFRTRAGAARYSASSR
jgi:hypothetical protein